MRASKEEDVEIEIANSILSFVQNLDEEDSLEFAKLYMRSLTNSGLKFDYHEVINHVADVDVRFQEVVNMEDLNNE